uniref:Magnetosome protein Mad8 n=1 Tax=bacterium FH-1 TaxID=1297054 RepID=M1RG82_UNCXX|nr:magnetosome protein Mad8 [bacterium FH-1]
MIENAQSYESRVAAIRSQKGRVAKPDAEYLEDALEAPRQVGVSDVLSVGTKVVIGGGVGLLAGIATIAVVASAGELILAGVVTKIAGVVGGALGLTMGLGDIKKKLH